MSHVLVRGIRGHTGPLQSTLVFDPDSSLEPRCHLDLRWRSARKGKCGKLGHQGCEMANMKFGVVGSWSCHIVTHWGTQERKRKLSTGHCYGQIDCRSPQGLSIDCFFPPTCPACPGLFIQKVPHRARNTGRIGACKRELGGHALCAQSPEGARCHCVYTDKGLAKWPHMHFVRLFSHRASVYLAGQMYRGQE